ncbi:ATP-grasp domain-containing protein [Kitasatospora sp. NPDC059327]|uniref:ATP-grasp domain-containing protein n=1 Tax=Kitasatospora sp. NPDC059327 TaxID=3346803 RepID=UPI00368A41BF
MTRRRVLVVGWKKPLLKKAKELGVEVWYVQHPELHQPETREYADVTLLLDYTDQALLVPAVVALHSTHPFDAVVGIAEDALLPVAELNSTLGLRGPSRDTVRLLTDKWAMRGRLAERGVSPVRSAIGTSAADLTAFGDRVGYPFIAKPIAGYGSYGIALVHGPAEAAAVSAGFQAVGSPAFLAEEFLDGPEVSAECFSFHGRHLVLAVTDKLVGDSFVEAGHAVPARLDAATEAAVVILVRDFLDAVELTDGPSHIEVKLTPDGPRIIEGHNRRGGDRINELVELVYGIDMETLTVAWALDLVPPLQEPPPLGRAAAVRFLAAQPGTLTEITGTDVAERPDVVQLQINVTPGQRLGPVEWSDDRPGFVLTTGDTAAAAMAAGEHCAQRVVFHTRPEPAPQAPEPATANGPRRSLDQAELLGYRRPNGQQREGSGHHAEQGPPAS